MKILLLDIETAPNAGYMWGLFKQNISLSQMISSGYTMCWAAKWYGERKVYFKGVNTGTEKEMIQQIWDLLDEADAVVHYNGQKFDIPTLNKDFVKNGFHPPSTYKQIDLYRVVKSNFRLPSYKLEYVLEFFGVGKKFKNSGFEMWVKCMAGNKKAWKEMEKYNKIDTKSLEALYERLLPWIKGHPNTGMYVDDVADKCPRCGGSVVRNGHDYTPMSKFQRFRCKECGSNLRGRKNILDRTNMLVGV